MPSQYQSRLPEIIERLPGAVRAALTAGAQEVAQSAKDRVPVDTGRLQRAIHTEPTDEGVSVIAGDHDVFYGHMVEHGTTHSPPHPFLVPALEEHREDILATVIAAVRKAT